MSIVNIPSRIDRSVSSHSPVLLCTAPLRQELLAPQSASSHSHNKDQLETELLQHLNEIPHHPSREGWTARPPKEEEKEETEGQIQYRATYVQPGSDDKDSDFCPTAGKEHAAAATPTKLSQVLDDQTLPNPSEAGELPTKTAHMQNLATHSHQPGSSPEPTPYLLKCFDRLSPFSNPDSQQLLASSSHHIPFPSW